MPLGGKTSEPGEALQELLVPSLAYTQPNEPLYSVRAGFLVAFFGGVHACLIFAWLNTRRMRRTRDDAWLFALLFVAATAAVIWFSYLAVANLPFPTFLSLTGERARDQRYVLRALSLVMFGAIYLRQQAMYRASVAAGQDAPSPWKAGLAAVAVGTAITIGAGLLTMFGR